MTVSPEPDMAAPAVKAGSSFSDLRTRIATALIIATMAVGALIAGGFVFTLFWQIAAIAMYWEWQTMIGGGAHRARVMIGVAGLSIAGGLAANFFPESALLVIAVTALVVGLVAHRGRRLWSSGGVLYAGVFILAITGIRPPGLGVLEPAANICCILWLFAVVWGTDVMAYFGGRLIGGPKLWPRVSAGKTWSGAIIGIGCGALLGLLVVTLYPVTKPVPYGPLLLCGLVGAASSQIGDLLESGIKRRFGVKDSSHLLPGHGGVMDRLDGFWAAALFLLALGVARGAPTIAEGLFLWG